MSIQFSVVHCYSLRGTLASRYSLLATFFYSLFLIMYKIAIKQEQYSTYILADESAQSFLEVVPQRGGIITSWRIQGQNILYLDKERFADASLSIRGGIPILFPICGNLPGNFYTDRDRQYSLKQHGFARDLPWQVNTTNTDNCASINLSLTNNSQTLEVYPFEFKLDLIYQLQGNSLKIQQRFENLSDRPMPFSSGLHPYFWVKDKDKTQLEFDIPSPAYQDQISKEIHSFNGNFDLNKEELDLVFGAIERHSTSITDKQRRLKIQINYSDFYSTLVFWTIKGKDYVCLEPWSAPRNSLNTGDKLTYLQPKTSCDATVEMVVSYL
jgi:galactose mutarotase-like enzyme